MDPPALTRLLAAATRLPDPWLTHAAPFRGQVAYEALALAEFARYLADLARAGEAAELATCLAAVDEALRGPDRAFAAAVAEHVVGAVVHMAGVKGMVASLTAVALTGEHPHPPYRAPSP